MPIHPVAQYRHNSLTFIMAREMKVNYYVVHRIDRLTSGIVIFAKTKEVSQDLTRQITKREVQKEYVCRVVGKFPKAETCDGALFCISSRKGFLLFLGNFSHLIKNIKIRIIFCQFRKFNHFIEIFEADQNILFWF